MPSTLPPPGWYHDPERPGEERYWDGARWTDQHLPTPPSTPAPQPEPQPQPAAGWYHDPERPGEERYWDGARWTDQHLPAPPKESPGVEEDSVPEPAAGSSVEAAEPLSEPPVVEETSAPQTVADSPVTLPLSGPVADEMATVASAREILERHRRRFDEAPIYIRPDIPEKQLRGALSSYAKCVSAESVLALVDTSLRKSGKTGMVLTDTMLVAHELMSTKQVPFAELETIEGEGNFLKANDDNLIAFVAGETRDDLATLLHELAADAHRPDTPAATLGDPDRVPRPPAAAGPPAARAAPVAVPAGPEDAPKPSLGRAIGFLVLGVILAAFPVIAFLTIISEDCTSSGGTYECVSTSGNLQTTTTINLPLVVVVAVFAVVFLGRGIALFAISARGALFRRFVAFLVDVAGIALIRTILVAVTPDGFRAALGPALVITVVAYFAWGSAVGQTLGRRLLGVAVMRRDHPAVVDQPVDATVSSEVAATAKPGWRHGLIRSAVGGFAGLLYGLGYLWALWNPDDRTLGDLAAKTVVFRVIPDEALGATPRPGAHSTLEPEGSGTIRS